jgi:hypothetical protein
MDMKQEASTNPCGCLCCNASPSLFPVHCWLDQVQIASILVLNGERQERVNHGVTQQMRLQAEITKLGAFDIVVMFLFLHSRVGYMLNLQSQVAVHS